MDFPTTSQLFNNMLRSNNQRRSQLAPGGQIQLGRKPLVFATLLVAALLPQDAHTAPDDIVMELEGSSNLWQWNEINIEALSMRDGKLRLNETSDANQFYRLKIIDAKSVARTKLMNFRDAGVPPLIVEDYADLGLSGAHPTNIDQLNIAVFGADASTIASQDLLQQLVQTTADSQIDVDAAAYARRTGLGGDPLMRLSGFIRDIKNAGINPELMYLGRREFLARDGNIHRAFYGDDASIVGSVPNNTGGFEIDSGTGQFLYTNPEALKSSSVKNMGVYIVANAMAGTGSNTRSLFGNDSWPEYRAGSMSFTSDERRIVVSESIDGTSGVRGRNHYHPGIVFNDPILCWFEISPSSATSVTIKPGFGYNSDGGRDLDNVWRDYTTGYLGTNKKGEDRLLGEISLVLMTDKAANKERLINALVKHDIAGINPPSYSILVGDSMTIGSAGAPTSKSRSPQLFVLQDSGWKGSMYSNIAAGGTSVNGQKEFYDIALNRFAEMPDCGPKVLWFWGGYNDRGDYDSNTKAMALADKYIAMAADAASRGIKTVHWSTIVSNPNSQERFDRIQLFNDYYRDQIALLEGDHIYYDHRVKFSEGQFDWNTRKEEYFSDLIHLSELGQQVLVADFLSKHPNP